ncbi:type IV secretory system conjugative DNA transfer family protein, partial [Brevibacillus sp. IT-7CA2]|uniref:type IV secretory system conjugative DNA transfer family protein n=1 Tax=Brevibacillus sp. IT-7CA2 TaxID=3026436 RepID=UPI0039E1FDD0
MSTLTANNLPYRNPLQWGGDDAFTHSLWVGPTRCGKTATLIKPFIYQTLLAKRRGKPVGLTLIEPKGDVVAMVKEMSEAMEIECNILDPKNPGTSGRFNVMAGNIETISEATVSVLKSMFGKQEAFFSIVQELSSRNVTKLLKELYQDDMDIMDVLKNLRDEELLKRNVEMMENKFGETELVQFFKN